MKTDEKTSAPARLYELLGEMAKGLDQLYQVLRRQQSALIGWEIKKFVSTVKEQETLIKGNLKREEQRKSLVAEMVGDKHDHRIKLSELAQRCGEPWPKRFGKVAEQIRRSSDKVVSMRSQNEFLINRAKKLVQEHLHLLLELAQLNRNVYEVSGKKSKKSNLYKVLDQKV